MVMKNLDDYIRKCIQDACECEGRDIKSDPSQLEKYFYIVIDDCVLFSIYTKWEKVNRRVRYRLRNNLEKNFGLKWYSSKYLLVKYYRRVTVALAIGGILVDGKTRWGIEDLEPQFQGSEGLSNLYNGEYEWETSISEFLVNLRRFVNKDKIPKIRYCSENVTVL